MKSLKRKNGFPRQLVALENSIGTSELLIYSKSFYRIISTTRFFSEFSILMLFLEFRIPISSFQKTRVYIQLLQFQHPFLSPFLLNCHWPLPGMSFLCPSIREIVRSTFSPFTMLSSFVLISLLRYLSYKISAASYISNLLKFASLWSLTIF